MKIKPKEYLKDITKEGEIQYYLILDVDSDNKIIKVMEYNGTPCKINSEYPYCEVMEEYSIVVIPEKEIVCEPVTEPYMRGGMECDRIIGYEYSFDDKELIVDSPRTYFNGTEFVDIPDGF